MNHMKLQLEKIAAPLILAAFVLIALFGFAAMAHNPDGRMSGDCPFSVMGESLCPQNNLAVAIHHISASHSFLNVPVSFGLMVSLIAFLLTIAAIFAFSSSLPLFSLPALASGCSDSPPVYSRDRKIIRWLSLFENSPSRF